MKDLQHVSKIMDMICLIVLCLNGNILFHKLFHRK